MLFARLNIYLRPSSLQILMQKLYKTTDCKASSTEGKHEISKPDCKTVVITGGTGAIGLAIAHQLLCSKARKIALIDTDTCKGKDAVSSINCTFGKEKAIFLKADVTNRMEIEDALKKVRGDFKNVDMIINTFGIWDEKRWEEEIKINLLGTLTVNQIAKDILVKPGGFVLNIIGLPGLEVFSPSPVLAASFNGVLGYTTAMGHENNSSHTGVRIVALCCGVTQTNFSKDASERTCCPQMGNDLRKYLKDACWQKPDVVAQAAIELIKYAKSGTIWVVEGSRLFSVNLPDLVKTFRHLEKQFI